MAIARLSVDLVAQMATFEADLKRAAGLAEQQSRRMEKAFGLASAGVQVLVGALSVGATAAFFRGIVDGVDSLNDFADAVGTSVENASALEDVARRSGAGVDVARDAVLKLNQQLANAKPGSDAEKALQAIGLSAEDLRRADPAEALLAVSTALAGYADDAGKARLVQDLFGKSVKEVAPFLRDLADAGELNAKVTAQQAKDAETFNKRLAELQTKASDAARALGMEVVPAINQVFDAAAGRGVGGENPLNDLLVVPLQAVTVLGANVQFVLKGIGTEIGGIAAQAAALARLDLKGAGVIGDAMKADAKAAREEFDALERRLMQIGRAFPQADYSNEGRAKLAAIAYSGGGSGSGGTGGGKGRTAKTDKPFMGPMPDDAWLGAQRAIESTDVRKLADLNAQLERLTGMQPSPEVAEAIGDLKAKIEAIDPALQSAAEQKRRFDAILATTPSAKLGEVLKDVEAINAEFAKGEMSAEKWAELMQTAAGKLGDGAKEPLDKLSTFADEASRNIQDSLGDTLVTAMRGDFDSIGDLWKDMLTRMIAEAAAVQLNEALFGKMGGVGGAGGLLGSLGGAGGWLESLNLGSLFGVSFDGGGFTGAGSRSGGIDGKGGFPAILHPNETVIDHAKGQRLGGATTINASFVINEATDARQTARLVEQRLAQYDRRQQRRAAYG